MIGTDNHLVSSTYIIGVTFTVNLHIFSKHVLNLFYVYYKMYRQIILEYLPILRKSIPSCWKSQFSIILLHLLKHLWIRKEINSWCYNQYELLKCRLLVFNFFITSQVSLQYILMRTVAIYTEDEQFQPLTVIIEAYIKKINLMNISKTIRKNNNFLRQNETNYSFIGKL